MAAPSDMKTRQHPTHHANYRPMRSVWGASIAMAGVFACVFLAMWDTAEAPILVHGVKVTAMWAGVLAFVGGTLVTGVTEIAHRFTRCPSCNRLLFRRRIDFRSSYYPCRRCEVTWTCPCHKGARG